MRPWMIAGFGVPLLFALEPDAWACLIDTDCSGTTPICSSGVCAPCTSDVACTVANPLTPNCDTSGGPDNGSCFSCVTSPGECQAPTPFCQLGSLLCVACLNSSQCTGASNPVCNVSNGQCLPCQGNYDADGGVLLDCSDPSLPACQPSEAGALAGQCTQCSATNASLCTGNEPVCVTTKGDCGCNSDADCTTVGEVCDPSMGSAGQCVVGCRASPDHCGAGEYCAVSDGGSIGTCEPGCKTGEDCMSPTPVCNPMHVCVAGDGGASDASSSDASMSDGSTGDGAGADGAAGEGGSRDGNVGDGGHGDGSAGDGGKRDGGTGKPDGGLNADGGGSSPVGVGDILEGGGCDCTLGSSNEGSFAGALLGISLAVAARARRAGRGVRRVRTRS
jgi:hypothetical protein